MRACQPWNSKVHFLNFLLNIYGVPFIQVWFQIKFTPITGESSKVHFLNFLLNIYGVPFIQFWFQIKFTPITDELFIYFDTYILYRVYKKNWTDLKLLSISQNTYLYPVFYIYSFFGYL
jgi:hypothetical protein